MKRNITIALALLLAACGKKNGPNPAKDPASAILTAPAKDQTCTNGTVLSNTESSVAFSWNASANTDAYELTVKNLLTQKDIVQQTTTPNATVTLSRNTPYSWSVTSKKAKASAQSETWKFYNAGAGVTSYAPFPADIITPAFGEILSPANGKVNLTWKGSSVDNNISGYVVYFGPNNNPDIFRERITDAFVNDVTVSTNTTYYWRVVTVDKNGNISDSGMQNFYVK
jgi:hypothetical protein